MFFQIWFIIKENCQSWTNISSANKYKAELIVFIFEIVTCLVSSFSTDNVLNSGIYCHKLKASW